LRHIASVAVVLGLTLFAAPVAFANDSHSVRVEKRSRRVNHMWRKLPRLGHEPVRVGSVPELDPSALGQALALLLGGAATSRLRPRQVADRRR
jgi:hypothetical protein